VPLEAFYLSRYVTRMGDVGAHFCYLPFIASALFLEMLGSSWESEAIEGSQMVEKRNITQYSVVTGRVHGILCKEIL